jgi:hypothetical protein
MIKTLIVLRLKELGDKLLRRTRGGGKSKAMKVLFAALVLYCIVAFLGMFGGMFYLLCEPFATMDLAWLYFALAGVLCAVLCFFSTIFFSFSKLRPNSSGATDYITIFTYLSTPLKSCTIME